MATKIKVPIGGTEKGKKPTSSELAAANKLAKRLSVQRGLIIGENAHTGGQIPRFIDAKTGADITGMPDPGMVGRVNTRVPDYVKSLEWDEHASLPYYIDEKTGDVQYVPKEYFGLPRFKNPAIARENPLGNIRATERSITQIPSANRISPASTASLVSGIKR